MKTRLAIVGALALLAVIAALVYAAAAARGFSAREQPTRFERVTARLVRRWAVPARARDARNPVTFSQETWADSRAHFADHCATCHANDGSGQTAIGRNLYPKAPDMRLADTQRLTDGQLYHIIENGVRLTGMPAWGSGRDDDEDTWKLVHFIRHLGDLTPAHIKAMEGFNPKSPSDLEEERADQQFLAGENDHPASPHDAHHHDKDKP
jgi:mono/diheme cytochrome c family protein